MENVGLILKKFSSLPSRERGLKFLNHPAYIRPKDVAPLTGAWIEIMFIPGFETMSNVAPLTGAWIEMDASRQ